MNDHLRLSLRHIDGLWHLVARDADMEHTHRHGFARRGDAWRLLEEVREALAGGRDLNLRFWEASG